MLAMVPLLPDISRPAFFFGSFLSLLLTTAFLGRRYRPLVKISFQFPQFMHRNEWEKIELTVINPTSKPAFNLVFRLTDIPSCWTVRIDEKRIDQIAPNGSFTAMILVRSSRRGHFPIPPIELETTYPFDIFRTKQRLVPQASLIVAPARDTWKETEFDQFAENIEHIRADSLRDKLSREEYVGNREYVPGMPVHRWDYRSWARLSKPIVREYGGESGGSVALVLDTCLPIGSREACPPLESIERVLSRAVEVAQSLHAFQIPLEDLVFPEARLVCPITQQDPGSQQTWLIRELALYPDDKHSKLSGLLRSIEQITHETRLLVVITAKWDEERSRTFRELTRLFPESTIQIIAIGSKPEIVFHSHFAGNGSRIRTGETFG